MMAVCATGDAGEADAGEQESYSPVTLAIVDGEWTELSAPLVVPDCELVTFTIYFDGPPPEVDFYVDDISLVAVE